MIGDTKGSPSVLIVDDDAPLRRTLAFLLRKDGYNVTVFASADEFLDATLPRGPSCILLDVVMPGMTGLELQQRLAEREYCPPIVFMSGSCELPEVIQAMENGAVSFLKKPFDTDNLLSKVKLAVQKSHESLELAESKR